MGAPGGAVCGCVSRVDWRVAENVVEDVLDATHPGAQTLA
jgi:hypothetical protein